MVIHKAEVTKRFLDPRFRGDDRTQNTKLKNLVIPAQAGIQSAH